MRAGMLTKRARFERRNAGAVGDSGERLSAWAVIPGLNATPCALYPRRGGERPEAGGLDEWQNFDLRVRSGSRTRTVTPGDRVIVAGQTYNIRSVVNPDQRNIGLLMVVSLEAPE